MTEDVSMPVKKEESGE